MTDKTLTLPITAAVGQPAPIAVVTQAPGGGDARVTFAGTMEAATEHAKRVCADLNRDAWVVVVASRHMAKNRVERTEITAQTTAEMKALAVKHYPDLDPDVVAAVAVGQLHVEQRSPVTAETVNVMRTLVRGVKGHSHAKEGALHSLRRYTDVTPPQASVGGYVLHKKRDAIYEIVDYTNLFTITPLDGHKMEIVTPRGAIYAVTVQVSDPASVTPNCDWFVYQQHVTKPTFVRPLHEFTPERFEVLA